MTKQRSKAGDGPWVLELRTPRMLEPMQVRLTKQLVIGRHDITDKLQPDVDLEPFGATELGVSRQHLAVYAEGDELRVRDLHSGNGTLLNGARLEPDTAYPLRNEDVLQLGHMRLDVRIIISPTYGSIMQKQPSLQLHDAVRPGSGQLILIVDDHPEVAKVFSTMLEQAGYATQVSRDVVGAIRAFNQKRPDAVLLDIMLPDMSGVEFCRFVRRDINNSGVPIIIISAAKTPENVQKAMEAGADIFLGKPVSAQELRHVVASLISQHESGMSALQTKQLVGTAPLHALEPESRRNSAVLFVMGDSDSPITLTLDKPVSFGRTVNLPSKNHVDLSRYDAVAHGVSRVHMFLHYKDERFYVEDADSVNGTFVNGNATKPHVLVSVNNADEIRLGELRMYIYFLSDEDLESEEA